MGEYAIYNGREVKIGTCENMYYLRLEDRDRVQYNGSWLDCTFRVPVPEEDNIQIGAYPSCFNVNTYLYDRTKDRYFSGDDFTLQHPGMVQLSHDNGYILCVPCYHGQKLPENTGEICIDWNGKATDIFRLSGIYYNPKKEIKFIVSCRFCGEIFTCNLKEIEPYLTYSPVLLQRLKNYLK